MASIALENDKQDARNLEEPVANVEAKDPTHIEDTSNATKATSNPSRPLMIYTRPQLVHLHSSPLVQPPADMPTLKDWFGSENEQNLNKKEPEPSTSTNARDRRFRRDPEDGETAPRPTYRSTLTQPSQMGNFKHHSLRTSDRERDSADKDRERDIRDKEGQERLRNLSDKYDRDRLALPAGVPNPRSKPRDAAPHLAPGASGRLGPRNELDTATARRSDPREPAKKKIGETIEDWRRGNEPTRSGRDDRENRERPRSRVRDPSRPRQETSTSRRDRDDRDRDRDRDRREREREDHRKDDYRRDRDEQHRRDRDSERELELDDPRRWRDDGKRDERIGARRERAPSERDNRDRERIRERDKGSDVWDSSDRHDRHSTGVEERDGRSKRSSVRDRRPVAGADEGKDDRRERDREREKEKEPAWMDTYIPTGFASAILGGTGGDGELDGIQAFKKGMKEKENRDNAGTLSGSRQKESPNSDVTTSLSGLASHSDPPLDEIQLFKLMMKREEEKKRSETMKDSQTETKQISGISTPDTPDSAPLKAIVQRASLASFTNDSPVTSTVASNGITRSPLTPLIDGSHEGSRPPLPAQPPNPGSTPTQTSTTDYLQDRPNSSRLFCATISSETHPPAPLTIERSPDDASSPSASSSSQFNPPPGSRLLALGARAPPKPPPQISQSTIPQSPNGLQHLSHASQVNTSAYQSGSQTPLSQSSHVSLKSPLSDTSHAQQGFSPFGDPSQSSVTPKEQSDPISYQNTLDALRRPPGMERPSFDSGAASSEPFTTPTYPLNGQGSFSDVNGAGYAAGKGSRFAKFFDGKSRDGSQYGGSKAVGPPGFPSSSPAPSQRQEAGGFQHGGVIGNADTRSMNEIYTMLSNSAQGQRVNPSSGMYPFQSSNSLPPVSSQQVHQQALSAGNRLDSLYDSGLDDRAFVPDGLVPGLRSSGTRGRDNAFSEQMDDPMKFNMQRTPAQRTPDQMFGGSAPSMYAQQTVGRNTIPIQPQYRRGPSPIQTQNPLASGQQQRLPPGLANLGGRPPHEPSLYLNPQLGLPHNPIHGAAHANGQSAQSFGFVPGGGVGYGGIPQMRGAPPGLHQLQSPLGHGSMAGLGVHPASIELRGSNQAQLLAMSGGLRGGGAGFTQQSLTGQVHSPLLIRQQQQQHQHQHHQQQLPPHMMPHIGPSHQPQGLATADTQPAHDLMALLMGGSRG